LLTNAELTPDLAENIALEYLKGSQESLRQHWYNFISRTIRYEDRLREAFQRIFRRQREEVLDNIFTDYFFDIDKWNGIIEDELIKQFTQIVEAEGNIVLAQELSKSFTKQGVIGGFDVENPYVREITEGRALKLSPEINVETQQELRATLIAGHEAGESMPMLARRVQELFVGFEDYRALRIARTETITTSNAAAEEAFVQSGVRKGKKWLTAFSERTCIGCQQMNGRTAPLREPFDTSGVDLDLSYYGGELYRPVAHPNCRCCLISF